MTGFKAPSYIQNGPGWGVVSGSNPGRRFKYIGSWYRYRYLGNRCGRVSSYTKEVSALETDCAPSVNIRRPSLLVSLDYQDLDIWGRNWTLARHWPKPHSTRLVRWIWTVRSGVFHSLMSHGTGFLQIVVSKLTILNSLGNTRLLLNSFMPEASKVRSVTTKSSSGRHTRT